MSDIDFNLLRRGLNKIKSTSSDPVARTTADLLVAYMDSMDGKIVETLPEELELQKGEAFWDDEKEKEDSLFLAKCAQRPLQMVAMIKDMRGAFTLGLKEAKDFVEGSTVLQVSKDQLQRLETIAANHRVQIIVNAK